MLIVTSKIIMFRLIPSQHWTSRQLRSLNCSTTNPSVGGYQRRASEKCSRICQVVETLSGVTRARGVAWCSGGVPRRLVRISTSGWPARGRRGLWWPSMRSSTRGRLTSGGVSARRSSLRRLELWNVIKSVKYLMAVMVSSFFNSIFYFIPQWQCDALC